MARALDAALASMSSAIAAVLFFEFVAQLTDSGTTTSAESPTPHSAVQVVLPLAETATVELFAAVALLYRHLHHAAAAGDRRLSELVTFMLCASAGTLQHVLFVQDAGVVIDVGAQGRALGLAAATLTFFLGMAIVLVHVRAGGGGRGGAVSGDGPVMQILSKMALGAAAALVAVVGIIAMSFYTTKY